MKPDTETRHGSLWKLTWLETLIAERGHEDRTIVVIDNRTELLTDLNRRTQKTAGRSRQSLPTGCRP